MKNYSQNDEQAVILNFFNGRTGRFLDIGAYDGVDLSNTRALVETGWTGIMVEPSPFNICSLLESLNGDEDRVEVWGCAVSDTGSPAVLHMSDVPGRQFACSISDDDALVSMHTIVRKKIKFTVPTVRISELLNSGPFNFISIDAEYTDFRILKDSPIGLGGCELLCVESSGPEPRGQVIDYINGTLGFKVIHQTTENLIAERVR